MSVLPANVDQAIRFRVHERLAKATSMAGDFVDSLQIYEQACSLASSPLEQATAKLGMGTAQQRLGDWGAAISLLDEALQALKRARGQRLIRILWQTTWQLGACTIRWVVLRCRSVEERTQAALAAEIHHRLGEIYICCGDLIRYVQVSAGYCFQGLRSGDVGLSAEGFSKLGYNNAAFSLAWPSKWMLSRAESIAKLSQNELSIATVRSFTGFSSYCLGELDHSKQCCIESLEYLNRIGENWFRLADTHNLRHVYSLEADTENELDCAHSEIKIGEATGDPEALAWGNYGLANAFARTGASTRHKVE